MFFLATQVSVKNISFDISFDVSYNKLTTPQQFYVTYILKF